MTEPVRWLLLGTGGQFTCHVLKSLIDQTCLPLAYVQSGQRPSQESTEFANIKLEIIQSENTFINLLNTHNIPIYYQHATDIPALIKQLKIDFLLVACWPELLSRPIINSTTKASLNLHPSLLPNFRGADPIQDQLKAGNNNFGISLHLINEHFDAGDIVLQNQLVFNHQTDKPKIEKRAAEEGALLFIQALETYQNPGWDLKKQKQVLKTEL